MRHRWLSLCTVWPSHSTCRSEQISFITTMRLPILQLPCRLFFWQSIINPGLSAPLQPRFGSLRLLAFPKAKIAFEREEIYECDGHTVQKLSQRCLTADWLAPQESDCSQMQSKVSSDGCQELHQGHITVSQDIENGKILCGQPTRIIYLFVSQAYSPYPVSPTQLSPCTLHFCYPLYNSRS